MQNKLYEHFTYVVQENTELSSKLQQAETEVANLKSANERMEHRLLALSEKLEDANNEIGRLGMVLKHRAKERPSERWLGMQNDWHDLATSHH